MSLACLMYKSVSVLTTVCAFEDISNKGNYPLFPSIYLHCVGQFTYQSLHLCFWHLTLLQANLRHLHSILPMSNMQAKPYIILSILYFSDLRSQIIFSVFPAFCRTGAIWPYPSMLCCNAIFLTLLFFSLQKKSLLGANNSKRLWIAQTI